MTHKPTIECEHVTKTFPAGKREIAVVSDVNLTVRPGEFVILYGPSGSGKSTLLNLIAGLELPSKGEIKIRGYYLSHMNHRELANVHRTRIGMVFQQFNLVHTLTAVENVMLPQMFLGKHAKERKERSLKLMALFEIENLANQLPTELSGGEQQRLAIARAMVNDPWLLLVDEPTGNLDTKTAKEVMDIIADLNRHAHHTILLVTHNPDYLGMAHRVMFLKDGKIVREQQIRPYSPPPATSKDGHRYAKLRAKHE